MSPYNVQGPWDTMNKADPVSNTGTYRPVVTHWFFSLTTNMHAKNTPETIKMPILPSLSLLLIPRQPAILRVTPALEQSQTQINT